MDKKNIKYNTPPILRGYNFSPSEARKARRNNRLLSMRLETSYICNLNCIYCNRTAEKRPLHEISFKKIKDVVSEAKDLGAKSIVVIGGGEPTIYPRFRAIIRYINKNKMTAVVITNGLKLTRDMCLFLYKQNASILFKLDSLDEKIQDRLCGKKGAFRLIMKGVANLFSSPFLDKRQKGLLRCGASFVVTRLNYKGIPDLWKFCRDNNIYPNLEELIPRGNAARQGRKLWVNKKELYDLKKRLLRLDRESYGYDWLVHAPLPGHGCLQTYYSVYVASDGYVRPCADINIKFYNVKDMSVKDIINTPFFKCARYIEKHLQGRCRFCVYGDVCVGCRGRAFNIGVDEGLNPYQALCREDPLCCKR